MKLNLKWSLGNRKMKKSKVVAFAIPRCITCPMRGACDGREMVAGKIVKTGSGWCYCQKSRDQYPQVAPARDFNLVQTKRADFVPNACADIRKIDSGIYRPHDEGDYYAQSYINKWAQVAREFPRVRFYSYTTSLHLDFSQLPANFRIVQSCASLLPVDPRKMHAKVFKTHAERITAGYADGAPDGVDLPSLKTCPTKIGLVLH